jgi:hypothetical protein
MEPGEQLFGGGNSGRAIGTELLLKNQSKAGCLPVPEFVYRLSVPGSFHRQLPGSFQQLTSSLRPTLGMRGVTIEPQSGSSRDGLANGVWGATPLGLKRFVGRAP